MLHSEGIPLFSKDRKKSPIIIGGGDSLTLNPFPFADFFDLIILGDGNAWTNEFPEILRDMPAGFSRKEDILERAKNISGTWVPSGDDGGNIFRSKYDSPDPMFTPILSSFSHFPNMFLVEAQRGCAFDCAFCSSPWLGKPFQNIPAKKIIESYDNFGFGAKRIGLIGSAIAEHGELEFLIEEFSKRGAGIHPSSIRLDRISGNTLKMLANSGLKNVTFAPETASEKLAKTIGKWISPGELIAQTEKLASYGFREVKTYWIIGLPGESDGDLDAIVETLLEISSIPNIGISASLNAFIPKPHSRFYTSPMLSDDELSRKFEILKRGLKRGKGIKFELSYSTNTRVSALLSIGDKTLSKPLSEIASGAGIKKAFKDSGFDLSREIKISPNHPTERIA